MAQLLIVEEKHGDEHYLIENDAELAAVCLELIKTRHGEGYYPSTADARERVARAVSSELARELGAAGLELLKTPEEQLPPGLVAAREGAVAIRDKITARCERRHRQEREDAELVEKLVSLPEEEALALTWHGRNAAREFLFWRRDAEYEGVRLARFSNA